MPVCAEMAEHSVEGRSRYSRESGEALGFGVERGGFDSYGRPLEHIFNSIEEGIEEGNMKTDTESKVNSIQLNLTVEDECFYLLHNNVFCLTAREGVMLAELTLARMFLGKGVEEVYHMFIEPEALDQGFRAENAKESQKIPLDLALFSGNYQQKVEEIVKFLLALPDCWKLTPLYCLPKYKKQNQLMLAWLMSRVKEDLAVEVKFKMNSLFLQLYELVREENKITNTSLSMSSLSGFDSKVPNISVAEVQLVRDTFFYTPGLSCGWHGDVFTMDKRWRFPLCCPLYGLEMVPDKHCPVEEMAMSTAGSITTTMFNCSGDTGYSKEVERDVTSACKNMCMANSVEDLESFCEQEQLKTNIRRARGWPWYHGQGLHGGGNKVEEARGSSSQLDHNTFNMVKKEEMGMTPSNMKELALDEMTIAETGVSQGTSTNNADDLEVTSVLTPSLEPVSMDQLHADESTYYCDPGDNCGEDKVTILLSQ